MRLLLDQNVSSRMCDALADILEGADHVIDLDLDRATDHRVWGVARRDGYILGPTSLIQSTLLESAETIRAESGEQPRKAWAVPAGVLAYLIDT